MDDETMLESILRENPWQEVAEPWLKRLQKGDDSPYVLPEDGTFLCPKGKAVEGLQLNLPPQPFIGDPRAPVWLLLKQPSYSPADIFGCCVTTAAQREQIAQASGFAPTCFRRSEALAQRQALLMGQLTLSKGAPFYVLDESFHTLEKDKLSGRTLHGTYHWWKHVFSKELPDANPQRSIFVLELFPYHAKELKVKGSDLRKTRHYALWEKLVRYGAQHKQLIVRQGIRTEVERALGDTLPKSALTFSGQQVLLTRNNLIEATHHGSKDAHTRALGKQRAWKLLCSALKKA